MLEVKLLNIVNSMPVIEKLYKLSDEQKLLFTTNIKLKKLIKAIQPEFEDFNNEKNKLLVKFGEKVEGDNDAYRILDPLAYQKYFTELLNLEITLPIVPFKLSEFENLRDLTISDINNLEPFLEPTVEETVARKPISLNLE